MAYPEYDFNEPSLGQTFADLLRGVKNPKSWQEVGQGIQNVAKVTPSVVESLGRGALVQLPALAGDTSQLARQIAPQMMQNTFGNRYMPTSEEILSNVPRMTPNYQGSQSHEMIGGVISPAMGAVAAGIKPISATNSAYQNMARPFNSAYGNIETALTNPPMLLNVDLANKAGMDLSRLRLYEAQKAAGQDKKFLPSGQGVWESSTGMPEYNPVFMQKFAKSTAPVRNQKELGQFAQLAENLEQEGAGIARFVPQLINDPKNASAAMLSNITPAEVKKMGEAGLSGQMVMAARPNNKMMIMDFSDESGKIPDLVNKVKEVAPKAKVKYGVSKQNVDRVYATREPSEYSVGYQELGAKPRKSALLDSFDEFLRRQTYK